jgi:hypothetical protein
VCTVTDWNESDSHALLRTWLLISPLNLFQAAMLIFGRDPSHELTGRPQGYVPIMEAMKQAIERGELSAKRTVDPYWGTKHYSLDVEDKTFVKREDVREWLKTIGKDDAFFFLAEPKDWPNNPTATPATEDKKLDARERNTLLRIIRALDVMAGLPQRGAATPVEVQLQTMGFDNPKEATIRKLLEETRALETDRKPQ